MDTTKMTTFSQLPKRLWLDLKKVFVNVAVKDHIESRNELVTSAVKVPIKTMMFCVKNESELGNVNVAGEKLEKENWFVFVAIDLGKRLEKYYEIQFGKRPLRPTGISVLAAILGILGSFRLTMLITMVRLTVKAFMEIVALPLHYIDGPSVMGFRNSFNCSVSTATWVRQEMAGFVPTKKTG